MNTLFKKSKNHINLMKLYNTTLWFLNEFQHILKLFKIIEM